MIPSQRHLFDIPDEIAYFNCAYMGPLTKAARAAGHKGIDRKSLPWTVSPVDFFTESERARALFAELIGATADDITIIPSASYGLAIAARNIPLEQGQKILLLEDQFPSNVYCWQQRAKETGAEIVTLKTPADHDWTPVVLAAIDETVALAALPHNLWTDGALLDLKAIGAALRATGAKLVLDVTQSLGALPLSVKEVKPDFLIAAAYKWLLSPYATGYLYVASRHQSGVPLEQNWINRSDARDFTRLTDYRDSYDAGARRFDMGERSNHQLLPAALESLKLINGLGVTDIARQCAATSTMIKEGVAPLGLLADIPDQAAHYLSLSLPDNAPADIAARLREQDIHASQRGPRLRISAHIYNTEEDVGRLVSALKAILG